MSSCTSRSFGMHPKSAVLPDLQPGGWKRSYLRIDMSLNLAASPPCDFCLLMRDSHRKADMTGRVEQGIDCAPAKMRGDSVIGC
jgi:hypothetical protein